MTYHQQLVKPQNYETVLDQYLEQFFMIRLASMTEERQGLNRIIRLANPSLKIAYKCDSRADTSRDAFIETKSVVSGDYTITPGWALSTDADLVIYYLTRSRAFYLINPKTLRAMLPSWSKLFPSQRVPNHSSAIGYETEGLLVPLFVLNNLFGRFTIP